jgi:hypothetical protein
MRKTHVLVGLPKYRRRARVHKYDDDMSKIEVVTTSGRTNN